MSFLKKNKNVYDLMKALSKARKLVEKSTATILAIRGRRDKRAEFLLDCSEVSAVPHDREIVAFQKGIDREEGTIRKQEIVIPLLERRISASIDELKKKALNFLDEKKKSATEKHKQKYNHYLEEKKRITALQKKVGLSYTELNSAIKTNDKARTLLTSSVMRDLLFAPKYLLENNSSIKILLQANPDLCEQVSPFLQKHLDELDVTARRSDRTSRKEKELRIEKRRRITNEAIRWIDNNYYPRELASSAEFITVEMLCQYWISSGIDPLRDYDSHQVLVKTKTDTEPIKNNPTVGEKELIAI